MMFATQLSGFINLLMEGIHRDSVLVGNGSFVVCSLDFYDTEGKKRLCVRTVLFFLISVSHNKKSDYHSNNSVS